MKYYENLLKELFETESILVKNDDYVHLSLLLIKQDKAFNVIPNGDLGVYIRVKTY